MARSFWSRRADSQGVTEYPTTSAPQSRPRSILLAVLGILVIGFLLFGIFQGARWTFDKLSGSDTTVVDRGENTSGGNVVTTNPDSAPNTPAPRPSTTPVTETSSTATTAPNRANLPATNTQTLPSTGPTSNAVLFFGVLIVSYLISRKKSLNNQ